MVSDVFSHNISYNLFAITMMSLSGVAVTHDIQLQESFRGAMMTENLWSDDPLHRIQ
jgi:hypothetical protein